MSQPPRDPELSQLLDAYRQASTPDAETRDRVWQAVESGTGAAATSAAAGSGVPTALKLSVVLGLLVGGGALLWPRDVAPTPTTAGTAETAPAAAVGATPVGEAPDQDGPAVSETPGDERDRVAQHGPNAQAEPAGSGPAAGQARQDQGTEGDGHDGARRVPPEKRRKRDATGGSLAEELRLLTAARTARTGGAPRRALRALRRHAERFPSGVMAEEREAERVFALCALGQRRAGQRVARRFAARFPGSPLSARVGAACAERQP